MASGRPGPVAAAIEAQSMPLMPEDEPHLARDLRAALALLLAALPDAQRSAACLPWTHPGRVQWDSGPRARSVGLLWSEMASTARPLVEVVLSLLHSPYGQRRIWGIRSLETILGRLEGGRAHRDPDRYWVSVFGDPASDCCSFRFEGHHLSVNATVVRDRVRATPLFRATNPACVPADDARAGWRVLDREEDTARAWANALSPASRAQATLPTPPAGDTRTGIRSQLAQNDVAPEGVPLDALTIAERTAVLTAVDAWVDHLAPTLAAGLRTRNLDRSPTVCWQGEAAPGAAHAWRFTAGDLLIDVAQAQNAGNHIHAVVREYSGDFADFSA